MYNYLIKLTPHDKFFFGTGKEFGADNQNYFVKSGYFPQQTTLLGMLRYQLLCQADKRIFNNNKIQDKTEATKIIGSESFRKGKHNTFGEIESLSPVFLIKNNNALYPLGKEYQMNKGCYVMREISKDFSLLKDYNHKKELPELWTDNDNKKYSLSDIFTEVEQVGIRKNYEGGSDDNAFYMQTYQKFKSSDMAFAFYAKLKSNIEIKPNNMVFIGGERQSFNMTVEKVSHDFELDKGLYQASKHAHKVILLSDAHCNTNTVEYCDFAITETLGFRCLVSEVGKTEKFYSIPRSKDRDEKEQAYKRFLNQYKAKNLHKSEQLELYKRSSVFYFSDKDKMKEFTEKLKKSEFYTIGYNHFITINKQ